MAIFVYKFLIDSQCKIPGIRAVWYDKCGICEVLVIQGTGWDNNIDVRRWILCMIWLGSPVWDLARQKVKFSLTHSHTHTGQAGTANPAQAQWDLYLWLDLHILSLLHSTPLLTLLEISPDPSPTSTLSLLPHQWSKYIFVWLARNLLTNVYSKPEMSKVTWLAFNLYYGHSDNEWYDCRSLLE